MIKRFVTLAFVLATITVNGLANGLPINGQTTGEVSGRFEVFVTPAGYVFSIWGLIYLLLTGFAVYQLLPGQRNNSLIDRIALPLWISSLANMSWIVLWHYEVFGLTIFVMLILLGSLALVWNTLFIAKPAESLTQRLLLYLPFSVYVAWVTIATLVNLSVVLEAYDLRPFGLGARSWASGMVIVGGLIGLIVARVRRDLAFLLVVIWAFIGIAVKQGWSGGVAIVAMLFTAALLIQALLLVVRRRDAARGARS